MISKTTGSRAVNTLIFDMDGTLVDNMGYHNAAWEVWFKAHGLAFEHASFFASTAGRTNGEIIAQFMPKEPVANYPELIREKEQAYQDLYAPKRALMPGLLPLLQSAKTLGLPCAVGTAAPQMNIGFILDALDIAGYFQTVVNPGATIRGKPHPDIFLEAAKRLGVAPAGCVVFEDAPLGLQAASTGGMASVALSTHASESALWAESPLCVRADFTQLALRRAAGLIQLEW